MRNQKGITLIALVITIIVLLILAGVTIAMLSGDNGILGRATTTKAANAEAQAREQSNLALATVRTEIAAQLVQNGNYVPTTDANLIKIVTDDLAPKAPKDSSTGKYTSTGDTAGKDTTSGWQVTQSLQNGNEIQMIYTNSALERADGSHTIEYKIVLTNGTTTTSPTASIELVEPSSYTYI
jgi:type II secretory pathway pseudopilin PulG